MPEQVLWHIPVLLHESVSGLNLKEGDTAIDATLGLGGHSELLLRSVGAQGVVLGIDADSEALRLARERLSAFPQMRYALGNFRDINLHAKAVGLAEAQGILFDLGWNTTQLEAGRGFSFRSDDPLSMTYAASPAPDAPNAASIVNEWSEADLVEVVRTLGEERFAGRIARAIALRRRARRIERASELAKIIEDAVPMFYRRGKIHPATKTFQALRILVNDELSSLAEGLKKAFTLLAPGLPAAPGRPTQAGGRIAIITFHSLEDGLVKRLFKTLAANTRATIITKKPIVPSREEIIKNPRARSAKLRIIESL